MAKTQKTTKGIEQTGNKKKVIHTWRTTDPVVARALNQLEGDAYSRMVEQREKRKNLKRHINRVFDGDMSLTPSTTKTNILRGHQCQTEIEQFSRGFNIPLFDVEPVNMARKGTEALISKTNASLVKAGVQWFMRFVGYEGVFEKGKPELFGIGDFIRTPFVKKSRTGVVTPGIQIRYTDKILIDPNSRDITCDSYVEQAQFIAYTDIYTKEDLVARFGVWVLDHVINGTMIDSNILPEKTMVSKTQYYEVIEYQHKSDGVELLLIGSNAFPIIRNVDGDETVPPKNIADKVSWSGKYKYKNSFGENILTLGHSWCYYDSDSPFNRGIAQKVAPAQLIGEIGENFKVDNLIQKLDVIKYLVGGSDRTDATLRKYRKEKLQFRDAVWKIPSSLNKVNKPELGVLEPKGMPAQEGILLTQEVDNLIKNMTGVSPQRQEKQLNTSATQVEVLEEEKTDSIEAIAEKNLAGFEYELRMFLIFLIAHKGFGLEKVTVNYTQFYDEESGTELPMGNPAASISIKALAERLKDFEYNVIIDKSSLIKKSRAVENQKIVNVMGSLPIQEGSQEIAMFFVKQLAKNLGQPIPEEVLERFKPVAASGGNSQAKTIPNANQQQSAPEQAPAQAQPTPLQ